MQSLRVRISNRCFDCTCSAGRTLTWSSSVGIFPVVTPGSVQVVYEARTVNLPIDALLSPMVDFTCEARGHLVEIFVGFA
ncbi:hypothetical protein Prudu_009783 [Prunus dulcis]|uniref:Uncharacterized protein n=1 Tax=Prunus dulcis TaxID=3755 RepID=A0A4Y1R7K8_PRUDU|nr:hypothetical protein Prudu_009783 [Prunus dulcis]